MLQQPEQDSKDNPPIYGLYTAWHALGVQDSELMAKSTADLER